jgi:1-acyl-sn-glycerol-3-phosphate acyltransferase
VNSGLFWPHGGARHSPGTVTVSYLAPLPPGLTGAEFMRGTQGAIDAELNRWRTSGASAMTMASAEAS